MTGTLLIASVLATLSLAAAVSRPVPKAAVVRPEAGL
jgi:hypothetical protein